jgi:hypothetical protein
MEFNDTHKWAWRITRLYKCQVLLLQPVTLFSIFVHRVLLRERQEKVSREEISYDQVPEDSFPMYTSFPQTYQVFL